MNQDVKVKCSVCGQEQIIQVEVGKRQCQAGCQTCESFILGFVIPQIGRWKVPNEIVIQKAQDFIDDVPNPN